MAKFDFSELTDFEKDILSVASEIKDGKESVKFLRRTGSKLRRRTLKVAKARVNKKTGNLFKGIKRGRPYKYHDGSMAVRVYGGSPAFHAHLLEHGHRVVVHGKEVGFAKGHHFFEGGADMYEPEYYEDTRKFIDDILNDKLL